MDNERHGSIAGPAQEFEASPFYRTLCVVSPVGIFKTDPSGACVYVNQRWCEIAGLTAEQAVGDGWVRGLHPEDRQRVRDAWYQAAVRRRPFVSEHRFLRQDGAVTWVLARAAEERADDGELWGYVGTATDITELKRKDAEVRALNTDLEARVEARVREAERTAELLHGLHGITSAGETGLEDKVRAILRLGCRQFGLPVGILTKAEEAPGETCVSAPVHVGGEVFGTLRFSGAGSLGVQSSKLDQEKLKLLALSIGGELARHRAAEAVRASEARMRGIVDTAVDAIISIDQSGVIDTFNPGAERMFGYSAAEVVGENVGILMPAPYRGEHDGYLSRYAETGERRIIGVGREVTGRRKDGVPFPLDLSVGETAEGGRRFTAILRDLTERKEVEASLAKAEAALRESERQYEQAQRLETIGRLAGEVAHDFNNLLMGIRGCAGLTASRLDGDDGAHRYLDEITNCTDRGASLTRQLLSFSRRRAAAPALLSLNDVVRQVELLIGRMAGKQVAVGLELDPSIEPIRADQAQLEQVIMNLIVNARDAMPDGGRLTVRTARGDGAAGSGRTEGWPGTVRLEVEDSGLGMDDATQERIFEPFFTTKPEGAGTGLGLSTVRGIVEEAGGWIQVLSQPGRGTTFVVRLPTASDVGSAGSDAAERAAPRRQSATILLVDDENLVRMSVRHYLEDRGYTVLEAADADEALTVCREHDGTIELLLTDVGLPGVSGPALARQVRELRPDTGILLMSGYPGSPAQSPVLRDLGSAAFLPKPFSAEELAAQVREVIGGSPGA